MFLDRLGEPLVRGVQKGDVNRDVFPETDRGHKGNAAIGGFVDIGRGVAGVLADAADRGSRGRDACEEVEANGVRWNRFGASWGHLADCL